MLALFYYERVSLNFEAKSKNHEQSQLDHRQGIHRHHL